MTPIDLFIFDLDGTLIDSKKDIAASVHHTMDTFGLSPISDEKIYSYVGNGVTPLLEQAVQDSTGLDFNALLSHFKDHYLEHCLDTTRLFPGMDRVLDAFRSIPKIVLTNKSQNFSEKIIEGLGLKATFEAVYGGDTSFPKKPAPDVVLHLLKQFQVAPTRAVIVGDSRVDIETGKNSGILTCGATYGFRPLQELIDSHCDRMIDEPLDLLKHYS